MSIPSYSSVMLHGGDEVGALVFDIGQHSLRVGYAQENVPRSEIPSSIGVTLDGNLNAAYNDCCFDLYKTNNITPKKYFIDTTSLNVASKGKEVINCMQDGLIDDFDLFEKILDYTYTKCLQSDPKLHPVLVSEASWNSRSKRGQLMELMFEKYNVPAFFLAKNALLAAFASSRQTALVLDSGASHTSAIPVHDGFVLTNGIVRSELGGDYITNHCMKYLQENNVEVISHYQVASKNAVNDREKAQWVPKTGNPQVTHSWHNYMVKHVIQDFQKSVLQVLETPYDEETVSSKPPAHYEFPNGYHQDFGFERFRITEALFDPNFVLMQERMRPYNILGAGHLVQTSVSRCDADVSAALYANVVVTGGNSNLEGFPERLNQDISKLIRKTTRLKVVSSNEFEDRRFAPWIGGSILASLGCFQQMWVSSQDYEESGCSELK